MGAPEWIARLQSLLASTSRLYTELLHAASQLPGFQFDETMSGTLSFGPGAALASGNRHVVLRLRARAGRLGDFLPEGRATLSGTATVDGLVEAAPISGSLWIWPHRRIVRYDL